MMDTPLGSGDSIWSEPDFVLTYIVTALINGMGIELGMTLMTRGLVITGTVISERAYLENITQVLMDQIDFDDPSVPKEAREALREILDLRLLNEFDIEHFANIEGVSEEADETPAAELEDDDLEDDEPVELPQPLQYLHLKDPMIVNNGEMPIGFGEGSDVVIRLKLASIDGWMIGRLMPDISDFLGFDEGGLRH